MEIDRVLLILGVAVLALTLIDINKSAVHCINYVPAPDAVLSTQWVKGLMLILVLIGCAYFTATKDFKGIIFVSVLVVVVSQINPILHIINRVDHTQYEKLNALIGKRDEMVSILPNYTDAQCQMTQKNYEKISALALDPKASDIIKNLPVHMPIDQVKAMCKETVFGK